MPIYWSMLIFTIIVGQISKIANQKKVWVEGKIEYRMQPFFLILIVGYLCFLIGLRDEVLDTRSYIAGFKALPDDWGQMKTYLTSISNSYGFYILEWIFKRIVDSYYVWLSVLAIVSCVSLFRIIYKYSINVPLSCYLFITASTFTWLLNGARQFLTVCILFTFSNWLFGNKKVCYILLALFLSSFHISALFVAIVAIFVSAKEIFPKKMILFVIITVIGTIFSESIFGFLGRTMVDDFSPVLVEGSGSNVLNLFIAAVPVLIVLLNFHNVIEIAPPSIRLAINMSFISVCFYFASTFTNGILVGRMPIYFTVYNLYLLPWIIENCFTLRSIKVVKVACILLYFILFYYQMYVAWGGLMYESYVLNNHYY